MRTRKVKHTIVKVFMLVVISCTMFAIPATAGVDSFSIYLNKKLLFSQSLNKPLLLQSLQLDNTKAGDELVIFYSQCNAPDKIASGRSILIKTADGKVIREWKFKDEAASVGGMTIPVKELAVIQKKNDHSSLVLFYAAANPHLEQELARL